MNVYWHGVTIFLISMIAMTKGNAVDADAISKVVVAIAVLFAIPHKSKAIG